MRRFLCNAAENGERIEMIYIDGKGVISQRNVKVLSVHAGNFNAYCYTRKTFRTFRIENVLAASPFRSFRRGA